MINENNNQEIKKITNEIKRINKTILALTSTLPRLESEIETTKHLKSSDNPREKMIYLEARRVYACTKNDIVNLNCVKLFKSEQLKMINSEHSQEAELGTE